MSQNASSDEIILDGKPATEANKKPKSSKTRKAHQKAILCNIKVNVARPNNSYAEKKGLPVTKTTDDMNSHAPAAELRAIGRWVTTEQALQWRKRDAKNRELIFLYPSNWEMARMKQFKIHGYRESLFDYDRVRELTIHKIPESCRGKVIGLICNDVYVADWASLMKKLGKITSHDVRLFYSGINLHGDICVDTLPGGYGKGIATVCVQRGGLYHCTAPDGVTRYKHKDTRPWKNLKVGKFPGGNGFMHKREVKVSPGRVCGIVLISQSFNNLACEPLEPVLSNVLVLEGEVPVLKSGDWGAYYAGNTKSEPTLLAAAHRAINDHFPDFQSVLTGLYIGDDMIISIVNEAIGRTLTGELRIESVLEFPGRPAHQTKAENAILLRANGLGFVAELLAPLASKATVLEKLVDLLSTIKRVFGRLVDYVRGFIRSVRPPPPPVDLTRNVQPCNVLWNIRRGLLQVGRLVSASGVKHAFAIDNALGRVSNTLGRFFEADTFFEAIGELIVDFGVVVVERLTIAHCGKIAAIAIAAVEVLTALLHYGSPDEPNWGVLFAAATALLAQTLLFFTPLAPAIVFQFLGDILVTGLVERLTRVLVDLIMKNRTFKGEFNHLVEKLRETVGQIRRWYYSTSHLVCENGGIIRDELFAWAPERAADIADTIVPSEHITAFCLNECVDLTLYIRGPAGACVVKANEAQCPDFHRAVEILLKFSSPMPDSRGIPIINSPILLGLVHTTTHPVVVLSAVMARYRNIVAPDISLIQRASAVYSRLEDSYDRVFGKRYAHPVTPEFVLRNGVEQGWSKGKLAAYKAAFDKWEASGEVCEKRPNIRGKPDESLKLRYTDDGQPWVKCRALYAFTPEHHVTFDTILWSHGLKPLFLEFVNTLVLAEDEKPPMHFYIPKKNTSSELSERVALMPNRTMLYLIQGDDTLLIYRTAKSKFLLVGADLSSCDTTLGPHLSGIFSLFERMGVPAITLDYVYGLCRAPAEWRCTNKAQSLDAHLTLLTPPKNNSGHGFTTLVSCTGSLGLAHETYRRWNGELSQFIPTWRECASELGLALEIEEHPNTSPADGFTPPGSVSFLATVMCLHDGRPTFIPFSITKLMFAKGVKPGDRGMTMSAAILARVSNPMLLATHYGVAIRKLFLRHPGLGDNPNIPHRPTKHSVYKMSFDITGPQLTLAEEFEFYKNHIPDLTLEEMVAELAHINGASSPETLDGAYLKIFEGMAIAHYGLLPVSDEKEELPL